MEDAAHASPPPEADAVTLKVENGSRKGLVAIVLLAVALVVTLGFLAFYLIELDAANSRIQEQERELEQQRILIDKKETFGAAMQGLVDTASKFDGVLVDDVVPFEEYERLAAEGWNDRWRPGAMDIGIDAVRTATSDLEQILAASNVEASSNSTGSKYEEVIDQLGAGFVASLIDDADALCGSDVLACVASENPYQVHFGAGNASLPYMTDWCAGRK